MESWSLHSLNHLEVPAESASFGYRNQVHRCLLNDFDLRKVEENAMVILRSGLRLAALVALSATVVNAQDNSSSEDKPKVFDDVIECQLIQEPLKRLACFDANVAKLSTAQQNKELFVADKKQIQKTQKGLFGFAIPKIRIFDNVGGDDIISISSKIMAVRQGPKGWIFELEDGAVWAQTDNRYSGRSPKPGQTLHVKKAALGSFMAKVDTGSAFRAERLNK